MSETVLSIRQPWAWFILHAGKDILAGSRPGDIVFDPFHGSGTVGSVAASLGRSWLACELNPEYIPMQEKRTAQAGLPL